MQDDILPIYDKIQLWKGQDHYPLPLPEGASKSFERGWWIEEKRALDTNPDGGEDE